MYHAVEMKGDRSLSFQQHDTFFYSFESSYSMNFLFNAFGVAVAYSLRIDFKKKHLVF
jgi:hypothetical protein